MLESLADFVEEAAEPDFSSFCCEPLLIVSPFEPDDDAGFKTLKGGAEQTPGLSFSVARVKKRPRANAFAMMITIGRASNNDIELKARGVSKFHAYLRQEGGRWLLTDSGSTFGTTVQGAPLQPRVEHRPLATGDEVRLGTDVRLVFVDAADTKRYLLAARTDGRFHVVRR